MKGMSFIEQVKYMFSSESKAGEMKLDFVTGVIILALIVVVLMGALRGIFLKQLCTASEPFTVASDSGAVYNFSASGLSCTTQGTLYTLTQALVGLIAVVAIIYKVAKGVNR